MGRATRRIGEPVFAFTEAAGFIRFLRLRGDQNPLLPSTRMPSYSEQSLTDAQARDIYAFIRTFRDGSPRAEDIAVFNAIIAAAFRPYRP